MSMIVVSPSTGTSAFGNVSVYGRSRRPAPAASTRPIMAGILPRGGRDIDDGCRLTRLAVALKPEPVQYGEAVLGNLPDHPVVDPAALVQHREIIRAQPAVLGVLARLQA